MANYFNKNMSLLKKNNPIMQIVDFYLPGIQDTEENVIKQDGILYFKYQEEYLRLHSENQKKEAEMLMQEVDSFRDHLIVLFGMGNTVLLRKLMTETSPGTRIAVFEPNVYVFKYILAHEDLSDILKSNKFGFMFGDEMSIQRAISIYMEQKWDNLAKNLRVISIPNYHVYSEFCIENLKHVTTKIDKMLLNLGTCLEDMLDGFQNHYQNVDACLTANGIAEIRDKYKGYPAIVVASGPSLDKNIHLLKQAQGKALIITCDASYTACKVNEVKPEIITSIERYRPTFQFYYEGKTFDKDLVLAGPSLLWPETYQLFPGRKILMAKTPGGLEKWWSSHFERMEFVSQGMSCANVAYAVAAEAGCNPIILIGQDLAYTGEKIHSDLTHTKYEGVNQGNYEEGISDIFVEDIYGEKVRTNIYYELFRHYFEQQILTNERLVIDATEGGAKIQGSLVMTLQEAMDQYCIREIPFRLTDILEEIPFETDAAIAKYQELIDSANEMLDNFRTVKQKVTAHYEKIVAYKDLNFEEIEEDKLYEIVMQMQEANKIITYVTEEKEELVSYYQQVVKQTIIAVKALGNAFNGKSVRRNWELQMNLMYLMDIATIATGRRFEEMIAFLEDKIEAVKGEGENIQ
ncbi:MAG: hypothetical protein PWP24_323 [Clostridiales bacterium]|nr:hypothetical protein [Clostridiales bacterium]